MEGQIDNFQQQIYDYLLKQKELEQKDIEANACLTDAEKVEVGLLIENAVVTRICKNEYELKTTVDNTKLRVGDLVKLYFGHKTSKAKVLDLGLDMLSIETNEQLDLGALVNIEVVEHVMLDSMLNLLSTIKEGCPGYGFMNILAGKEHPRTKGMGTINPSMVNTIPAALNQNQKKAVIDCLNRPSVYCLQGPPGTGKTAVLSAIAHTFAFKGKEVLVISNTHQAVNNALNKIAERSRDLSIVKIGDDIKSDGLNADIVNAQNYNQYLAIRKKSPRKRISADIVGMTLHASVINVGLRNTGFKPKIVLVDEAGQMPLAYASLIGAMGSGCIVFIGDDRQMPPIFHPQLVEHPFSVSIFEFLCNRYPELRFALNVTYRMNDEITRFVSENFYESSPASIKLVSADSAKNRRIHIEGIPTQPIQIVEIQPDDGCLNGLAHDANLAEASEALLWAHTALKNGMRTEDIAIITPYRKQVKLMRNLWNSWFPDCDMPLINTVECLQGQDVEMIVVSLVLSSKKGKFEQQLPFVLDKHRLNVMVSRAKTKVVILMSPDLKMYFDKINIY